MMCDDLLDTRTDVGIDLEVTEKLLQRISQYIP